MKRIYAIILIFIFLFSFLQIPLFGQTILPDSGKNEFKIQVGKDTPDYTKAYKILIKQVEENPENAELRYFLGYTIDRLNSNDGNGMPDSKKEMSIRASEQFETVNKLQPIYKGEILILDPYSKLTAIWGSLAGAYLGRALIDSAKWAFEEGKRRGAFSEPILEFNRQLLSSCSKNAILISSGDNITFPIWYLQTIEQYRADIIVVDGSLTNAIWYPKYLKREKNLKMNFSEATLDTLQYLQWEAKTVNIINLTDTSQQLSWVLRPTYWGNYILRGDWILLDIFQQNFFNRPVFFSTPSDSTFNLHLTSHLTNEGLVDRVSYQVVDNGKSEISENLHNYNLEKIRIDDVIKSPDAISILNGFRWAYLRSVYQLINIGNKDRAKNVLRMMIEKIPANKLPFASGEMEEYVQHLSQQLNNNLR
ncbi:MAG: hypothetical protein IT249_02365 [Chitinophagaceae bacterium]|nr:hypothetical protein [Chitinophagaceae bacterium]